MLGKSKAGNELAVEPRRCKVEDSLPLVEEVLILKVVRKLTSRVDPKHRL